MFCDYRHCPPHLPTLPSSPARIFHADLLASIVPPLYEQVCISAQCGSNTSCSGVRTSHSILNFRNFVEVLGIGQAEGAHTECMSRFLEVPFEIFPVAKLVSIVSPHKHHMI
jgi:hypothetical protein